MSEKQLQHCKWEVQIVVPTAWERLYPREAVELARRGGCVGERLFDARGRVWIMHNGKVLGRDA